MPAYSLSTVHKNAQSVLWIPAHHLKGTTPLHSPSTVQVTPTVHSASTGLSIFPFSMHRSEWLLFLKIYQIISISWLKSSNHNNKIQSSYCAQGLRWRGFCFSFPLKYPLDSMRAWHVLFSVPCTIPDRVVAP